MIKDNEKIAFPRILIQELPIIATTAANSTIKIN